MGKYNKNMNIGEIIKSHPGAEKVIEKYFGQGCFTCPGMNMESLAFGSTMHGVDPDKIVKELETVTA